MNNHLIGYIPQLYLMQTFNIIYSGFRYLEENTLSSGSKGCHGGPAPTPVKTSQKNGLPPQAASFTSHRAPLGQISGSTTDT